VLVLAIITTVIAPCCFLVGSRPPTPPSEISFVYRTEIILTKTLALAGSLQSPSLLTFVRAWVGLSHPPEAHMSIRERIDFTLIWAIFSTLVAASTDFSILTNQIFVSPILLSVVQTKIDWVLG
jgi:FLVCR family MFS transporter 7